MVIRPWWMEAQLRCHREVPWGLKRWGQSRHRGVPRASRPPFISRIEVDAVVNVREGQVDVEPHQFHCSTGIMVPGNED